MSNTNEILADLIESLERNEERILNKVNISENEIEIRTDSIIDNVLRQRDLLFNEIDKYKKNFILKRNQKQENKEALIKEITSAKDNLNDTNLTDAKLRDYEFRAHEYLNSFFKLRFFDQEFKPGDDLEDLMEKNVIGRLAIDYEDLQKINVDRLETLRFPKIVDLCEKIKPMFDLEDLQIFFTQLPNLNEFLIILASSHSSNQLFIFNENGQLRLEKKIEGQDIYRAHILNDGHLIVYGCLHNTIVEYEIANLKIVQKQSIELVKPRDPNDKPNKVDSIASSEDGKIYLLDEELRIYELDRRLHVKQIIDLLDFNINYKKHDSLNDLFCHKNRLYIAIEKTFSIIIFDLVCNSITKKIDLKDCPDVFIRIEFIDSKERTIIMSNEWPDEEVKLCLFDSHGNKIIHKKILPDYHAYCVAEDGKLVLFNADESRFYFF